MNNRDNFLPIVVLIKRTKEIKYELQSRRDIERPIVYYQDMLDIAILCKELEGIEYLSKDLLCHMAAEGEYK